MLHKDLAYKKELENLRQKSFMRLTPRVNFIRHFLNKTDCNLLETNTLAFLTKL